MDVLVALFCLSVIAMGYTYFGYPALLAVLVRLVARPVRTDAREYTPYVTVLVPVYNESRVIRQKLENLLTLDYPREYLEIVIVSDGSTDQTGAIVNEYLDRGVRFVQIAERRGKANALNRGLAEAQGEVVVFTDASIMLEPEALRNVVGPFQDSGVGCVSGEDRIEEADGEGAYGRYELFLRRQESRIASIVGASGSFYAERKSICKPFVEGMAPDFLSVVNAVEAGYRAVSEPSAVGTMTSVTDPRAEFRRKVRTLVRGYTVLTHKAHLLNPFRYGLFAFVLFSHKVMRWSVPLFMLLALISNALLLGHSPYGVLFTLQCVGYATALGAFLNVPVVSRSLMGRICLYFVSANLAILYAWLVFLRGGRLEVWTPSRRHG